MELKNYICENSFHCFSTQELQYTTSKWINGFCFVSVPEDHGCLMKQILQNVILKSKSIKDVLEASLKSCRKCLPLDVQKQFGAAQSDMERKRFAYSFSVSPNSNHLNNKGKYSITPNSHYLNIKTKRISTFPRLYDVSTVIGNNKLRGQNGQKYQHEFSASLKHKVNYLASMSRFSHRHAKASQNPHLKSSEFFLSNKAAHLPFSFVSKIIHLLKKKQQKLTSTFQKDFSDQLSYRKGDSSQSEHSSIQPKASLWHYDISRNCNQRNFSCMTEVLQPGRKRSSSFPSELDSEFVHFPKAALEFLSYSSTSCPSDMNEPLNHHIDFQILNSFLVQPSWLQYQPREPLGGCPTQFWPHTNPARIWPRILLMAKCVCDGSRCAQNGTHRCITIKISMLSLIRDTREGRDRARNVRRQKEMVAVGCVCAERKSMLIREHQAPIFM
jgi:hypothetical protein